MSFHDFVARGQWRQALSADEFAAIEDPFANCELRTKYYQLKANYHSPRNHLPPSYLLPPSDLPPHLLDPLVIQIDAAYRPIQPFRTITQIKKLDSPKPKKSASISYISQYLLNETKSDINSYQSLLLELNPNLSKWVSFPLFLIH
jgi:hypothetical protein